MAAFVDRVTVHVAAGNGAHGVSSVHREKFKPLGGPDGGNGGDGGDVVLEVDPNVHTLLDFHHSPHQKAANGKQAVEIAMREKPDLLVIDLNMPEVDGYQAIGQIRRDLSLATMPILVLTAEDGPGIEERVLTLGADDYIIKPFDPALLLARVNAVFRRLKAVAA